MALNTFTAILSFSSVTSFIQELPQAPLHDFGLTRETKDGYTEGTLGWYWAICEGGGVCHLKSKFLSLFCDDKGNILWEKLVEFNSGKEKSKKVKSKS